MYDGYNYDFDTDEIFTEKAQRRIHMFWCHAYHLIFS